jgi:hypothetical protein
MKQAKAKTKAKRQPQRPVRPRVPRVRPGDDPVYAAIGPSFTVGNPAETSTSNAMRT